MSTSRAMQSLAIAPSGAPLSKEQKSFNQLLNKIETQRKLLQEWEDATVSFRQKYATELKPLAQQCSELRVRFIHLLHGMHPQKGLTRRDREDLSELIAQLAEGEMLQAGDDAELKAIFEFHADMEPGELDASDRQGFESFKAMFEAEFGVPLDDSIHMDSSFQDLQRVMARAMADKLAAEGAAQPDADTAGAAHQQPKPRKKSAKTLAKEAAKAQEEQQISLSIREVYRKLASALHPDREPDPAERERKTALMQRVNDAYANKNLLQLLELQLELEHIDAAHLANLAPERLRHYTQILKDQLKELKDEVAFREMDFEMQFGPHTTGRWTPKKIRPWLQYELALARQGIQELKHLLVACQDVKQLKAFLKTAIV